MTRGPGLSLLITLLAGLFSPASALDRAVLLLFDTSGSLQLSDLDQARALGRELKQALGDDDAIGVMSFDDRSDLRAPLARDTQAFEAALASLRIQGRRTLLHDALYDAARLLADSGARRRVIVVMTDGKDEGSVLEFDDAERELQRAEVAVFPIGVGRRIEERFQRRLAKLRGGEYFPPGELERTATLREAILARVGELPASATPTPDPTPSLTPTPRPPAALVPGSTAAASTPASPVAHNLGYALMFLVPGLLVLGLILLVPLWLSRRRPAPLGEGPVASVADDSPPPPLPPSHPEVEPASGADEALAAPPTELSAFPDIAFPPPSPAEAEEEARTMHEDLGAETVIKTVPFGKAPPVPSPLPDMATPKRARTPGEEEPTDYRPDPTSVTLNASGPPLEEDSDIRGERIAPTFLLEELPVLVIRAGRESGGRYLLKLEGENTIGRAHINTVVLSDTAVSGRHACIKIEGRFHTVTDLGSTNGTFVNERKVERGQEQILQPGDIIRIGETELEYRLEQRRR